MIAFATLPAFASFAASPLLTPTSPSSSSPLRCPSRPRMTIATSRPRAAAAGLAKDSGATAVEPVRTIDGIDAYLEAMERSSERLVVLKIFAPWCRSCLALAPKVNRLAREFDQVDFVQMDYQKNKDLCHRLGVRTMPTFIFYRGVAGEIEKFSCGPQRAGVLRYKLEECLSGVCKLPAA